MKQKMLTDALKQLQTQQNLVQKILTTIHQQGASINDIVELVSFLNEQKISIETPNTPVFDVCGTGGTMKKRINISTALTIKLAHNFTIAKHGNKSSSGRCGSMDIVEKSKYELCTSVAQAKKSLAENNYAFLFAPSFHPTMGALSFIRKSLPHPTIFNIVGPLLNPVKNLSGQLIGAKDVETAYTLAQVCQKCNKNALVVHDTHFGLDEVSIGGETKYFKVLHGNLTEGVIVPEDFGFERVQNFKEIQGGDSIDENFDIFTALIEGTATKAQTDFLNINYEVAKYFFNECI